MRLLAGLLVLLFLLALPCAAQSGSMSSSTATMQVGVRVIAASTVDAARSLDFGTVTEGSGSVHVAPRSPQAGKFVLTGSTAAPVTVEVSRSSHLTGPEGEKLPVTMQLFGSSTDAPADAVPLEDGSAITFGESQRYFVYAGGDIDVRDGPTGVYEGEVTLTLTY